MILKIGAGCISFRFLLLLNDMRSLFRVCCAVFSSAALFFSCSLTKNIAVNSVSDMLAGGGDSDTALLALTGETDVRLVADFFPTALKLYEVLHFQNPRHVGLAVTTGSLYVMYANAFVQAEAEMLPIDRFGEQTEQFGRAKLFYLRGREYVLNALDTAYAGFAAAVRSSDADRVASAAARLKKSDVNAVYWLCAGWLGAFALDPLDPELLASSGSAVVLLERAAELDGSYNGGALWDVLAAYYAAAPAGFGGDPERAAFCQQESMRLSGGKVPGPYITYAVSFCVPAQDKAGFVDALRAALRIDPDEQPSSRLATVIAQKKAAWLLDHTDDYFIDWN
ncbi:hypothetical protein Trebr_1914 [Treponema brennaborense DSM 12168]|uniref:Uncharacterized protein n=2 Tax=Treponema TaxID=157 RepID=F4LJ24_TREBD|nr:hypothetical protein Trebr_1914 [Treponema brennaborense DSM 12168]